MVVVVVILVLMPYLLAALGSIPPAVASSTVAPPSTGSAPTGGTVDSPGVPGISATAGGWPSAFGNTSGGTGLDGPPPDVPRIVAVHPNTIYPGNAGEYVVVAFPVGTDPGEYRLVAGDTAVDLPAGTVAGPVAFSTAPSLAAGILAEAIPVVGLEGHFTIAASGGRVALLRGRTVVDAVEYGRAPMGRRWSRTGGTGGDGRWRWALPVEHVTTPQSVAATGADAAWIGPANATAFALPDAGGFPTAVLATAERRVLLGAYTLESRRTTATLVEAARRGVRVRVLVDGAPVGGQTARELEALDRLAAAGVDVRVLDGPRRRYRYHHPKYAVVDDRLLVMTENWKPAGAGGRSSRGWGVVLDDPRAAARAAAVFEADAGWTDAVPWPAARAGRTGVADTPANGSYRERFPPTEFTVDRARVVAAPEGAEATLVGMIAGAESSVDVLQVSIGGRGLAPLEAAIEAAERGVRVRILLDHSWYVAPDNRRLAAELNDLAARRDLPLEVRVVEPRGRFEKVHAKGVIVDDRRVLVGSINWNENSIGRNRELALLLEGEGVAGYFAAIFEADWRGGRWIVPVGFLGAVLTAGAVAAAVGRRRIRFAP